MALRVQGVGIEAITVVEDLESDARACREKRDHKGRGPGVAKAVAHGLLGNVKHLRGLGGTQPVRSRGVHFQLELSWTVAAGQS